MKIIENEGKKLENAAQKAFTAIFGGLKGIFTTE